MATEAAAQVDEGRYPGPGMILYANGGGFSTLRDVTEGGVNFDNGYTYGGGVGYQFNPYLALRGNLSFTRAELQAPAGGPAPGSPFVPGEEVDKYFYGADLQIRYPSPIGLAPYAVIGGGAVTVDTRSFESFTRPAGKFGAGLGYTFPGSRASVFAEWSSWVYQWDEDVVLDPNAANVDKTQVDSTWTGGLRFTF
jgi:hypothetical protein